MPSSPNKSIIETNIVSTLQGITIPNGYAQTVIGVDRVLRAPFGFGAGELPRLVVVTEPDPTRLEELAARQIRCVVPFDIYGCVLAPDAATRATAIDQLLDDTIAALFVDLYRGTTAGIRNATSTKVVDCWTTDSLDEERDSSGGRGLFVLRIECVYFRSTSRTAPIT